MPWTTTVEVEVAEHRAVDTNLLVAALVVEHEHHEVAVEPSVDADVVLGQVLVESWSVLRRHFRVSADDTSRLLLGYRSGRRLVPPPAEAYDEVLRTGRALGLAGNVHDAVIVRTAVSNDLALSTVDRGLHRLADGVVDCTLVAA